MSASRIEWGMIYQNLNYIGGIVTENIFQKNIIKTIFSISRRYNMAMSQTMFINARSTDGTYFAPFINAQLISVLLYFNIM